MTKGIIILAVCSLVLSATVFALMVYILITGDQLHSTKDKSPVDDENVSSHHLLQAIRLRLDKITVYVIVSFVLLISFLKMVFSVLLIIGMKKKKPGFVVAYFGFGVLLCLLLLVTALLELLEFLWYSAAVTVVFTFILMERLSAVHSAYENMRTGSDSNLLLQEDAFNDPEPDDIISD